MFKTELDLLNAEKRKAFIDHINGQTNQRRKDDAFKAYECLKDRTVNYVMELLLKQFSVATVQQMQYALSNISILRKVIEKLAKVYSNGVKRTMKAEKDTKAIEDAADYLKMNTAMKKTNKYFKTFKNTLVFVRPIKNKEFFDIKIEVLPPFKYDAVENPDNPELPMAIVLSDYTPTRKQLYALGDAAVAGRTGVKESDAPHLVQGYTPPASGIVKSDGATDPNDKREYIWWSENYHFTTNSKGELLTEKTADGKAESSTDNPIKEMPFVNFAGEQDGCFWADGGNDLVSTGIGINVDITNVKHIGNQQGYGQMFMTGKNLPKSVQVGPTHCIQIEVDDKDSPAPTLGILSSNPPLSDLKALIEMQVALMLTTNNLSTSGFSTSLSGGKDFASGIAMMIDKSESIEDIGEQSQIFIEREPMIWELFYKWLDAYRPTKKLTEEAKALKPVKKAEEVEIAFPTPVPMVSETEELAAIKTRKEIGLNTTIELLMRDDPSLTEEAAQIKLDKIKKEKADNAAEMGLDPNGDPANGDQGKEGLGGGKQNNGNPGSPVGGKDTGPGKSTDQA